MAETGSNKPLVAGVIDDLHAVRDRGLDRLDVDTKKQPRKQLPYLEPLALAYCAARGIAAYGRVGAIRIVLHRGLAAFARRGYPAERTLIKQLLFDPAGTGPRLPLDRAEAVRARSQLKPAEFNTQVRTVFEQFGRFLVAYVRAAVRQAQARQARTSATVPPSSPSSAGVVLASPAPASADAGQPVRRRRPVRWAGVALVGLVIAGVVVAQLLVGTSAPPQGATPVASASATTITGYVECWPDTTKAVEGVWITADDGGSGWADWHPLPGQPNIARFSRTLPHGGSYLVHTGCGGSPMRWQLPLDSVTPVLGGGYYFTCYDTLADRNPYAGQCRL